MPLSFHFFSCVHFSVEVFSEGKNWVSCKITVVNAGWGYFPVCPWSNMSNVLLIHVCALNFHMGL